MDKEKAARMLSKELGDKLGRKLVNEESYKRSLMECASIKYQVSNPLLIRYDEGTFYVKEHGVKRSSNDLVDLLTSCGDDFKEANYYFSESVPITSYGYSQRCVALFSVTPYALIGETEKSDLRRMFYKDAPLEIIDSMNLLGIENFLRLYMAYQEGKLYCSDISANKLLDDVNFLKKFMIAASTFTYDKDGEVAAQTFEKFGGIENLNYTLTRLGVNAALRLHDVHNTYVHNSCVTKVLREASKTIDQIKNQYYGNVSNEFVHFVFFSLPREDRNLGADKEILKTSLDLDFVTSVLAKEYSTHGFFCEYFKELSKEMQDETYKVVKRVEKRNAVFDSFLWSTGFKDSRLDHLELYKADAKGFIEYFPSRSLEEKKVIIKDIMESEHTNEKVINWLNTNYLELVREVGFNG